MKCVSSAMTPCKSYLIPRKIYIAGDKMTTQEERELRRKIEYDIRAMIDDYQQRTGYCVSGIDYSYETAESVGNESQTAIFTKINIRIN